MIFPPQDIKIDVEEESAVVIQCLLRRRMATKKLKSLKKDKAEQFFRMVQAAHFIQRVYRGHNGREKFKVVKKERAKWDKMEAELEMWAATKIQVSTVLLRLPIATTNYHHYCY